MTQSGSQEPDTNRATPFRDPSVPDAAPSSEAGSRKPRYIMIGGFLGAGKTTALAQLATKLVTDGFRVGLVTNDQGSDLVDTAMLRSRGFPTEEIAGGCFCCRFNSLMEAADRLTAETRPDVFVAEPVGSCTDLVATVTYPLRRIYGQNFTIAPLSVLIDPIRARRVLGLDATDRKFSSKVLYIYRKQLEEADLIVINKSDLLDPRALAELKQSLRTEYAQAELFEVSAREGWGLAPWFERITASEQQARAVMEMDYRLYGEGEALLGWLNATILWKDAAEEVEPDPALETLAGAIHAEFSKIDGEIAHLKMTLSPDQDLGGLAMINLVRNDFVPELSQGIDEPVDSGQLIINLRAEADPEALLEGVKQALAQTRNRFPALDLTIEHVEHFRPQRPQPTHRVTDPGEASSG